MIKTFTAKEPGRYVIIQRNLTMIPGVPHNIENEVTGYKMVIDTESGYYDSFIREGGDAWIPYSENRKVPNMEEFWREVGKGHLVEDA